VAAVGPPHFGILAVDCAKARSKWMLADFFGNVLVPPTVVEHQQDAFRAAHATLQQAVARHQLRDLLVAIERTGTYHRPVQEFFRQHTEYDVRLVHAYASCQHRQPADPGNKTDDTDLAGIFRAAVNGFGLLDPPWPDDYLHLQVLVRARRSLVRKTSTLQCQIREVLHQLMPGYAECFEKFWESTTAVPIARQTGSAEAVRQAGRAGLQQFLHEAQLRVHPQTLTKVLAWAETAPPTAPAAAFQRPILAHLLDDLTAKNRQIQELEASAAGVLARLPFVLLLAIPGINVVSAAELAGEMGPPSLYANANALTGRAALVPSRYQSDQVDRANGRLRRAGNHRLRFALLQIADNLLRHNHHYQVQATNRRWAERNRRWRCIKIAKAFSRLAFAMLAAQRIFGHPCCQPRHAILDKLLAFHTAHATPWPQVQRDLDAALNGLPRPRYAEEVPPLQERLEAIHRGRRGGPRPLADAIAQVLARLGIRGVQSEAEGPG
jgi:transposase